MRIKLIACHKQLFQLKKVNIKIIIVYFFSFKSNITLLIKTEIIVSIFERERKINHVKLHKKIYLINKYIVLIMINNIMSI
jgi:hypothetical protein